MVISLFLILSKNMIYAQFPPLNPTDSVKKNNNEIFTKEELKLINYKGVEETNFLFGFNFSKMILRPLSGGFSIDLEALYFFDKKRRWAVGGEFGYTEYRWKDNKWGNNGNLSIRNKGFYIKPTIAYFINLRPSLDDIILSISIPLGFFEEKGEAEIGNNYYINNPNNVTYYRPNQLFAGLEASLSYKKMLGDNFYVTPGFRYAPYIYNANRIDDIPMNTRYFAGVGYNQNHQDIQKNNSPWHTAFAIFLKIQTFF